MKSFGNVGKNTLKSEKKFPGIVERDRTVKPLVAIPQICIELLKFSVYIDHDHVLFDRVSPKSFPQQPGRQQPSTTSPSAIWPSLAVSGHLWSSLAVSGRLWFLTAVVPGRLW